jgi:putative ABC transport system substrate-binding protein
MTVTGAGVRDATDIEHAVTAFAREPNGGVIIAPSPIMTTKRELIIGLAAQLHLPAIYPFDLFPKNGGLVSYGVDRLDQVRGVASYVDRILRGANPGVIPYRPSLGSRQLRGIAQESKRRAAGSRPAFESASRKLGDA